MKQALKPVITATHLLSFTSFIKCIKGVPLKHKDGDGFFMVFLKVSLSLKWEIYFFPSANDQKLKW